MKTIITIIAVFTSFIGILQGQYLNRFDTYSSEAIGYQGFVFESDTLTLSIMYIDTIPPYLRQCFHVKCDMEGNMVIRKDLKVSTNSNFWALPHSLTSTQSKGFLSSGVFDSNEKWRKSFMAKLNHNLDTLWVREFTHGDTLTQLVAKGNIELSNKDCLLICEIWYLDENYYSKGHDILVIQTDSMGNEKNRMVYGYPLGYTGLGAGVLETINTVFSIPSGVFIGGSNGRNPTTGKGGSFIIHLDSLGNKITDYFTNFSDSVYARAYAISSLGMIGVAGGQGGKYHAISQDCIDSRAYIGIFAPNFQNLYKVLLPENYCYAEFWRMISTHDYGFVACGKDDNNSGWIIKMNMYGEIEWSRKHRIFNNFNFQYDHLLSDIVELPDKGFVAAGIAYDKIQATSPIVTNAWLIRTDSFGCLVPGCELVGIAENTPLESSIKLYPNPTSDRLFLYYNNPQLQNCVFTIRDMTGRETVPQTALQNSTTYEIVVRDWAQGLYFVRVQDENGNFYSEKFVKE